MEMNIADIAHSIRQDIERDASKGAKGLIDFARSYAVESKLRHEAFVLKLNYTRAEDPSRGRELQEEMLKLLDRVLEDYQEHGQSQKAQAERAVQQKLKDHYAGQKVSNDLIFEGKFLGKTFKSSGFQLKDVNLELRLGEITSVVGENGNGKTTLFRIVVGELQHDRGSLAYPSFMDGKGPKIKWAPVKRQIAYVPQDLPSWDGSLKQVLQFEAAIHGIKSKDNDREVAYIIQRLGLEEHLQKSWRQLSGGFKLRFALARALVWKPKLLIIDEPLANLDIKTQLIILKDLRSLANSFRYPMAVLLSSQHLHEIESVSNKILFLKDGEVTFYGELEELGVSRSYNTFEFNCGLTLDQLKAKFSNFPHKELYHNGISFVLTTELDKGARELLQFLLDQDIALDYFRDISQSVKQLFEL